MKYIITILLLIVSCTQTKENILKVGNKITNEQIINLSLEKNQMAIEVKEGTDLYDLTISDSELLLITVKNNKINDLQIIKNVNQPKSFRTYETITEYEIEKHLTNGSN